MIGCLLGIAWFVVSWFGFRFEVGFCILLLVIGYVWLGVLVSGLWWFVFV